MIEHEDYETLCALAVTEQISGRELEDLKRHCDTCLTCRDRFLEFIQVHEELLLSTEPQLENLRIPSGMHERFMARAASEGLPLTKISPVIVRQNRLMGASVAVIALLLFLSALHIFDPADKGMTHSVATANLVTREGLKLRSIEGSESITAHTPLHFSPRRHTIRMAHPADLPLDSAVKPVEAFTPSERFNFYLPSSIHSGHIDNEKIFIKPGSASLLAALSTVQIQAEDKEDLLSIHPPTVHRLSFVSLVRPEHELFRYNAISIASFRLPQLLELKEDMTLSFKPGIRPLQFQKPIDQ